MRDRFSMPCLLQAVFIGALAFIHTPLSLAAANVKVRDIVAALTQATEKQPIDLSGKDLSDLDLSKLDFKAAKLDWSNLFGVNLSSSNLRNVSLKGVTLDRAQLTNANFTKANLSGASILGPAIHRALESYIWHAPIFRESNLQDTRLSVSVRPVPPYMPLRTLR